MRGMRNACNHCNDRTKSLYDESRESEDVVLTLRIYAVILFIGDENPSVRNLMRALYFRNYKIHPPNGAKTDN
jgi:hypothetical protein